MEANKCLNIKLNDEQKEYKEMILNSFVESCHQVGLKDNIIEHLVPICEVCFLEGILCERLQNVNILNYENYN